MRELQVLGNGHLKLDFADWKEFFESEMAELVRGQVKRLLEQALLAERDRYLDLGYYEHDPQFRWDYRNGYYFRDFTTRLGRLQNLRIPRTRKGFSSAILPRYQRRQEAGQNLKLIITDGGTGLRAALPLAYPRIPVQLCWAHKMRNIAAKVRRKEGSCVAEAAAIYLAGSKSEAQRAFCRWRESWQHRRPRAVACVERDLENLLSFFSVPQGHWKKVRTTNVIERAFREVRRRTRPMSSFSNSDSCQRVIYGVISHLNSPWERKPLPEFTQTS